MNQEMVRSIYAKTPGEKQFERESMRIRTICRRYVEGVSLREIAKRFNVSHETIRLVLRENGVELRPRTCDIETPLGKEITESGYVKVYMGVGFIGANKQGWILKHRLVMQEELGRCLYPWEIVHHIDRNKMNNERSNLLMLLREEHPTCIGCPYYKYYVAKTGEKHIVA